MFNLINHIDLTNFPGGGGGGEEDEVVIIHRNILYLSRNAHT